MLNYLLDSMPIGLAYLCVAAFIVVSCELGFVIGRHYHRGDEDTSAPTSIGPMVGGLLGMLAFVLAFTFSMAATQYGVRKQNVLTEANMIGTAYLRADLLGEQRAAPIKQLLREYVEVRLQAARPGADLPAAISRSLQIHEALWSQVSEAARESGGGVSTLMVKATNDVIDMHEKRLSDAVRARIPHRIWFALAAIIVLTMGTLGLQVGLAGKRRMIATVPVALAFAVLASLVIDLNRPQGGAIIVGQEAMIDLHEEIDRTASPPAGATAPPLPTTPAVDPESLPEAP